MADQSKQSGSIWPTIALVATIFAALLSILIVPFNPFNLTIDVHNDALWSRILSSPIFSSPIFTPKETYNETDFASRARAILRSTPLVDGHNDFPFLLRSQLRNQIYQHDFTQLHLGSHSDLFKMRKGMMGGQFWSVWVPCPGGIDSGLLNFTAPSGTEPGLNEPNWAVRDTLEQIDITKRLVAAYPSHFQLCTEPSCVRTAHKAGKIASMIGIEGGHQTGNSLGALRLLFDNGVRYMTLTHNCDNAFAAAWTGVDATKPMDSREADSGLTSFGRELVREMNRLGMLVDLSHVSANTMRDTLHVARAPVIFSHSGAYTVQNHDRNVPDDVLVKVKSNGGVVMVPAVSFFLNVKHPDQATVEDMVDQIFHVASVAGWEHVGIGSDFDGSLAVPKGLEDTSKYPHLLARVLARGATDEQAKMLVGNNILRVWEEAEKTARKIQKGGELPNEAYWADREWGPDPGDIVPYLFPRT
ncbi:membrane dipeptidase-domain-containing protein [Talaromyces proteolyticus]|uniref:Dipeptidase n=1 Tax=Talaromyces proteolyticus TaxID=1131652 RepID=A0AAD4KVM7_9EURO|nr:membrane dipeptidase-domain-containing protein [Talaromyces proteolyticus]KAH8700839.1 membrane dipeptidase-domain-containing protein [Talaromyces proteolyticus]